MFLYCGNCGGISQCSTDFMIVSELLSIEGLFFSKERERESVYIGIYSEKDKKNFQILYIFIPHRFNTPQNKMKVVYMTFIFEKGLGLL